MRKHSFACEKCIYREEVDRVYCDICPFEKKVALDSIEDINANINPDILDALIGLGIVPEDEGEHDEWDDDSDDDMGSDTFDDGFITPAWLEMWKKESADSRFKKHGIILTNTQKCHSQYRENVITTLNEYINYKAKNGVKYCLLDLSDDKAVKRSSTLETNDLKFIIHLLRQAYDRAPIEYLMIIGDRSVVDSAKWENGLYREDGRGDSDKFVNSDLPYVFLENKSLFDGKPANRSIKVGRVPASGDWGFATALCYLTRVMAYHKERSDINSITMSAAEWGNVTRHIYRDISPISYDCPPYSFVEGKGSYNISRDYPYDLMCFNLHGSAMHNTWLSGNGTAGINSSSLPTQEGRLYVIGSEACYGAKPVIKRTIEQSLLITALRNNCLGFLGSTQIAYGITDGLYSIGAKPMCADIMVGRFADFVHSGYALGDAYMEAWSAVARSSNDQESTKTLCSFALYGDPTVALVLQDKIKISSKRNASPICKPFVDISSKMRSADIRKMPFHTVDRFIRENLPEYRGNLVGVYKVESYSEHRLNFTPISYNKNNKEYKEYKATYHSKGDGVTSILQVYFNEKGDIDRVYASK